MKILFNPQESLLVMKQEQSSAKKYGKVARGPHLLAVLGAVSGETRCTHVLYTGLYSCLVSSLGTDHFTVVFSHVVMW